MYRLPDLQRYVANYVYKSMINKCWITLPVVYSRPFTSKAVFWAILKEFEFAVDCSLYSQRPNPTPRTPSKSLKKTAFEVKRRLYTTGKVIQRLFTIDLYT